MQAVVRAPRFDVDTPTPWAVAPVAPRSWLALDASCSDEQVALFVMSLADPIDVGPPGGPTEVVDALLAQDLLIVAGGLRLCDTETGVAVSPGCCAGLEDWRDWAQVFTDSSPWLGHDPGPEVEFLGDEVRVWQYGGPDRHRGPRAGLRVDLPRAVLAALLTGVHRDLVGFLATLSGWAQRHGLGTRGRELVAAIDENLAITGAFPA